MIQGAESIQPGTVLAGRYRIERQLGEGGMGSVFLVEHVHTDQKLAVKILHSTVVKDAATLDRFRREARTPARIQSDHVCQVTDADVAPELGGLPFLVMEWLRGQDLGQISEARGVLPPREALTYLQQAARALDKAHAMGIVHRDLKPENLFLTTREDGSPWVKLLDFGIAKLTGEAGDLARVKSVTSTGQIFGTPLYMSPEQAKAEQAKISPQTDIWALGLIAHRLLTGTDFWVAETLTHLLAQIAYEPIPAPSTKGVAFGKAYDEWFLKCCAREAKDRYATAGEAIVALADALGLSDMNAAMGARLSVLPSESVSRSGAPVAFAATAALDPALSQSLAGASRSNSAPGSADAKSRRSSLGIGIGAAGILALGGLIAWLAVGRASGRDDGGQGAVSTPLAASGAPSVVGSSGVMVTPSPVVSASASAEPSTEPSAAASASAKPSATAVKPISTVKTAPRGDPDNPLDSRH